MVKGIAYTMYPVIDMARARKFYEEELGLVATFETPDGQWVEYEPGGRFALSTLAPVKPSKDSGGNVAFEVDDVVSLTEALKGKQVPIFLGVTETPAFHMSVVIDPEGNPVTLCQQKSPG
jgi:catechol 2,3-dioxygenase-like lactoylglutathione lyase family enzyme